ncbi:MAG: type II CAAX endopeptidase family protein [Stappiaceae bacterium]
MAPFETYILPARARTALWRFIVGFLVIVAFYVAGSILLFMAGSALLGVDLLGLNVPEPGSVAGALSNTPKGLIVMLASFASIWIGLWVAGRFLHKQNFATFFSPKAGPQLDLFLRGTAFGLLFALISLLIGLLISTPVRTDLEFSQWTFFLTPVVGMVFVQATAEELLFRGYLLQQFATRWNSWLIWAFLPSFFFGMLHFDPALPDHVGYYYVLATLLFGLTACILVWRSGSLWPAIGLHVSVNIVGLSSLSVPSHALGMELWMASDSEALQLMRVDIFLAFIALAVVLSPVGRFFEAKPEETSQLFK